MERNLSRQRHVWQCPIPGGWERSCLQGKTLRRPIRKFLLAPLFGDKVSIRDGIVVSDTDALEYKKLTYSPALVRSARRDSVLLPLI